MPQVAGSRRVRPQRSHHYAHRLGPRRQERNRGTSPHGAPNCPHFATFLQGLGRCQGAWGSRVKVGWLITTSPPLPGAGQGVGHIPHPTGQAWGGAFRRKLAFSSPRILVVRVEDRRSRTDLRAKRRKMTLQEETTRVTQSGFRQHHRGVFQN